MAAVLEYITTDEQINGANHTGVDIGDAHPDRNLLIMVVSRGGGSLGSQAMTVGGQQARRIGRSTVNMSHTQCSAWWVDSIPFGRTADIVIDGATGTTDYTMVAVYRCVNGEIYDAVSDAGTSTAVTGGTISIGGDSDYSAVGVCLGHINTDTIAWSGLTERIEDTIDESHMNDIYGVADLLDASEQELAVTATYDSSQSLIESMIVSVRSANAAREIVVEATNDGTSAFACPKGTNLLAVVVAGGASEVNVKYDGTSLTRIAQGVAGSASFAEVWILKNPPINSSALLTSTGGFEEHYAICLSGVDLKSVIEVAENSSTSTALTSFETVLGSLSDEVFLLDAFRLDSQVTPSVGAGQTSIETGSTADPEGWGFSYKTVDSSAFDSMSWTFASADEPAHAVAAFQPQRLKSPAYQYEEVEGTLVRMDFNHGFNDQGPYRSRWTKDSNSDPTFANGVATFDGVDDLIIAPFDSGGDGIFAISCWIKPTTWGGNDTILTLQSNGNPSIRLYRGLNSVKFIFDHGSTTNAILGTSAVNDGEWHHVVGVGDGSTMELFIDGVSNGSTAITASLFSVVKMAIGGYWDYLSGGGVIFPYDGDIADVRVMGRTLTNVEVSDLYARGRNNLPVRRTENYDPSLKFHFQPKLGGGTDLSGNGHHFTGIAESGNFGGIDNNGALSLSTIERGTINDLSVTAPVTLFMWLKLDDVSIKNKVFGGVSNTRAWGTTTNGRWQFTWPGLSDSLISGAVNNTIYLYAMTVDEAGDALYYINGVQIGSNSGASLSSSQDFQIGTALFGPATDHGGVHIYEMRVYDRALTNAEILELYKNTNPISNLNIPSVQKRQLHGCVGHWRAESEGRDLSGNGNHMTYEGDLATNGGLYEMDGTGDYGSIPHDESLSITSAGSLEAWIYCTDVTNENILVKNDGNTPADILFQFRVLGGEIRLGVCDNSSHSFLDTTSTPISTNTWYHVVGTWDGSNLYVYIDGAEEATASQTVTPTDPDCPVWMGSWNGGYNFSGLIAEARIYNRTLTNAEIKWLYQSGTPYRDAPEQRALSGLVRHYDPAHEAIDLTRQGPGGEYTNDATVSGGFYSFDGTGDYITTDFVGTGDEGTVSAWVKFDSLPSGTHAVVFSGGGSYVLINQSGSNVHWYWFTGSPAFTSSAVLSTDTWYHLVITREGGTVRGYINGVEDGSAVSGATWTETTFEIGGWPGQTTRTIDGVIDDVRIYNRALSAEEVALLYNGGTSGYVPSANHLEAPYQCLARISPSIEDSATLLTDHPWTVSYDGDVATEQDYGEHGTKAYGSVNSQDDHVNISIPDANKPDGDMSVFTWLKGESNNANTLGFGALGNNGYRGPLLGVNNAGSVIAYIASDASTLFSVSAAGHDETVWTNYASVFDAGTKLDLLRNGTSIASSTTSVPASQYTNNGKDWELLQRGSFNSGARWVGTGGDSMILPRVAHSGEVNWISSERGIQRPLDPYNPVAWWCPSLDFPNAGTDYLMDLARDQHGTLTNMVAADDWVISTERGGTRALDFDGTNDYVDVGSGLFNGWTQFTVATWIYADAITIRGSVLAQISDGSNYNFEFGPGYATAGNNNKFVCSFWSEGVDTWKTWVGTDCPTGEWVHYAAVWDGVGVKMFVNGVEDTVANTVGTANSPIQAVTNLNARIGGYERSPGYNFNGKVDDLRVYDKALPIEAIKNLASKRGWTPEERVIKTTASDVTPSTFPFWALIHDNNSFG